MRRWGAASPGARLGTNCRTLGLRFGTRAAGEFVGDVALAVFEPQLVDAAVEMLLQLKEDVDRFFSEGGWECRATVKGALW